MSKSIDTLRTYLFPFSWLYGLVVFVRNKLYDFRIFKSQSFTIPVICVGNITVGGTGKTPHVEYLLCLFQEEYKVAVLSRGYGRKTKGFRFVKSEDVSENVGDEPLQMKQKFPQITFAVDEKRARGIAKLQEAGFEMVILDDAFQHRAVKPTKSIVLMDYHRLPHKDSFLPSGNLRDGRTALKRADIVLVTKCPEHLSEQEKEQILTKNKICQPCFFTHFEYGEISNLQTEEILDNIESNEVLLVTGIANPKPLQSYLESRNVKVKELAFADHYNFTQKDLQHISEEFSKLETSQKIILTTEKDKVKLLPLSQNTPSLLAAFYYISIQVAFEGEKPETDFRKLLV